MWREQRQREEQKVEGTSESEMHVITPWMYPVSEFLPNIFFFFSTGVFLQYFGFLVRIGRQESSGEKQLYEHV